MAATATAKKTGTKAAAGKNGKAAKKTAAKAAVDQATKEIRWTPAKQGLLKALVKAGAVGEGSGITVDDVIAKSGKTLEPKNVRHQLNPRFDLTAQGYIGTEQHEGERFNRVYATTKAAKLVKAGFPEPAKAAE